MAQAWERGDLNAYLEFYSPDATQGDRAGKAAIAEYKRGLWAIKPPKSISFGGLQVSRHLRGFVVEFNQVYVGADGYLDRGRKALFLAPTSRDGWQIMEESWQG